MFKRVHPLLQGFLESMNLIHASFLFQVLVAPPLFRARPTWYQQGLAQVASRFSVVMSANQPANLFLLPSFVCQDLSPDGVHLSVVSGLHYVLHIFDQSVAILALEPREPELKLVKVQEAVRHHDDRLSYLESRHGSLQGQVSIKVAIDSEFKDWVTNRSEEDWMTIIGLPRLGQMSPREWQAAARKQVTNFLKDVLSGNRSRVELSVLYVGNPVRHRPNGNTVYNVRLNCVAASERIREIYSGFFSRRNPRQIPPAFRGISVRNKVTLATRVRIRILQQFASNYLASNPGASVNVKGFDSRPQLVITPPRGSTTSRQRSYGFIEACTMLPAVFSDDGLAQIFQVVGSHFPGELRALFVVLSDDDRERCENLAKNYRGQARQAATTSGPGQFSGTVSGAGTGMEVQSNLIGLLRSPPPPPPRSSSLAPRNQVERAQDSEDRLDPKSQRGLKRGHQDDRGDRDAKRHKQSRRTPTPSSSSSRDPSPPRRRKKQKKRKKTSRKSRRRQSSSSSSSSSSTSSSTGSGSASREKSRER